MQPTESGVIPFVCPFGFRPDITYSWSSVVFAVVVCIASISWAEVAANEHGQKTANQSADNAGTQGPAALKPRWTPGKPAKTTREPWHEPNRVIIKFAEGSEVRLRQQGLVSLKGRDLGQVRAVLARHHISPNQLRRYFTRPEAALDQEKIRGEAHSGRQLADLNLYADLLVAGDVDVGLLCDDLNALDIIELAEPAPAPSLPPVDLSPTTPDFSSQQGYRDAPPGGIGITNNQGINGIDGTGMAFVDVEYSWQLDHEDLELPASANIDTAATLSDPFSNTDHGTAVLGEIVGGNNSYGVTGIAPAATAMVAPTNTVQFGFSVGRAINLAAATLNPGDAILIEQQTSACGGACDTSQVGCGPVEWNQPEYDAIAAATANGVIVVEAAGNGSVNLDDPACLSRFDTAVRDSGAIIVGAGDPTTHAKLSFSTYGSRVNVQGWGQSVTTTGYGDLFDPPDILQRYTATFSGTSSASPIVSGAILAIQGALKAAGLNLLPPDQMRQLLINTGTPQSQTSSLHIGPLPDVGAALSSTLRVNAPTFTYPVGGETLLAGTTVNVTWNTNGAPVSPSISDDMESGSGLWNISHGAGTFDWALGTGNPLSGSYAWFASDPDTESDQYLASVGPVTVPVNGQLSFWHSYDTEATYDGGVVEISTDNVTWTDLGPYMTQNGYNTTIDTCCANPIGGRAAFSGNSGGYIETLVDLSSFSGQSVYIRFRMASDGNVSGNGWYVDDASIVNVASAWIPIATSLAGASDLSWTVPLNTGNDYCLSIVGSAPGNIVDSPRIMTNPFTVSDTDSDGDGLSDGYEIVVLGTNPLNVDSDGDGLADGAGGVVPLSALPIGIDINGDGFVDGEQDLGTDPAVSNVGDVGPRGNPDSMLDLGDLVVLTRLVTGATQPTPLESILADINNDNQLNAADILLLQQSILSGVAP